MYWFYFTLNILASLPSVIAFLILKKKYVFFAKRRYFTLILLVPLLPLFLGLFAVLFNSPYLIVGYISPERLKENAISTSVLGFVVSLFILGYYEIKFFIIRTRDKKKNGK